MTGKQATVEDILLEFQRQDGDGQRMIVRDLCHSNPAAKPRYLAAEWASAREERDAAEQRRWEEARA